jgi:hypothetical protein
MPSAIFVANNNVFTRYLENFVRISAAEGGHASGYYVKIVVL